jgi:hypothetical protein
MDYVIVANGLRSETGSLLSRPFVLNYSTSASKGTYGLAGVVHRRPWFDENCSASVGILRSLAPEMVSGRLAAVNITERHSFSKGAGSSLEHTTGRAPSEAFCAVSAPELTGHEVTMAPTTSGALARAPDARPDSGFDLPRPPRIFEAWTDVLVLLLQPGESAATPWLVRKATPVRQDGTFSFEGVRKGSYGVAAIEMGAGVDQISAVGFLDVDQDFLPDLHIVAGTDTTLLRIDMGRLPEVTAAEGVVVARGRVASVDAGARLVEVASASVKETGKAMSWTYRFVLPAYRIEAQVRVGSVATNTLLAPAAEGQGWSLDEIPWIDSERALAAAEAFAGAAFRTQFGPEVTTSATLVRRGTSAQHAPALWEIVYRSDVHGVTDTLIIDAATGIPDDDSPLAQPGSRAAVSDECRPVPNPFREFVQLGFSAVFTGEASVDIVDLVGRLRSRTVRNVGAGVTRLSLRVSELAPGAYVISCRWPGGHRAVIGIRSG